MQEQRLNKFLLHQLNTLKKKKKKKINPKQTGGCENINKNDRDIW